VRLSRWRGSKVCTRILRCVRLVIGRIAEPALPTISFDVNQHTAYIAIGSNLGDRQSFIERALQQLGEHSEIKVVQTSSVLETEPVGPGPQDQYLNAVLQIQTTLQPHPLLDFLIEIEHRLGRIRREKWGPRTIDLDILLFDDRVIDEQSLTIPHPRLQDRTFVLIPLCEIAPRMVHPLLHRSVENLLNELKRSLESKTRR